MDRDIQQYLNDLSSDDNNQTSSQPNDDEFLNEPENDQEESPSESNQTEKKPLYERFEDGELETDEETKPEQTREQVIDGLKDKVTNLYGGAIKSSTDKSDEHARHFLNIASKDREEALKDKIQEIDLDRKEDETQSKANNIGAGYINLKGLPIVPEALKLIPEEDSKRAGIICFMYKRDREIRVAILEVKSEVQEIIKRLEEEYEVPVKIYLTSKISMNAALKLYSSIPKIIREVDDIEILEKDMEKANDEVKDLKDLKERVKKGTATEILSLIISSGVKAQASDIHIEAESEDIKVRFRIDGVLHNVASLDTQVWDKLISRIKLSSKLKINIKDKPQDGSFSIHADGQEVDFRVSTLPTNYGESVVMRILYHEKVKSLTLENLGIEEYHSQLLLKEIKKPNGMIVITGPTGSGKTTTLYSVLNKLNTQDNKIITIEDPIEYKIQGINQSEVKPDKDYTFAKGLKSIVRQDPDIILVGEIRDKETTEIALNAALTGHLVFTTLHTNDAIGTISRFLALGAKPYLLSPALNIAVAQRLIRKICTDCKQEYHPNEEEKERVLRAMSTLPDMIRNKFKFDINSTVFYTGQGCEKCNGLGYKGQVGIFEIFESTDEVKEVILSENVSGHQLKEIAQRNGMTTMTQDGILKAVKGITSLEEVFRVA